MARRGRRLTARSACWEALLEYELTGGSNPEVTAARFRGQEYLLERRPFRRRSTGEVIDRDRNGGAAWIRFAFPTWWHYDVLRGLEYLRRAGVVPDERVAEAIDLVASKRDGDGRWPLETRHPGEIPVEMDEGEGRPSRWNTLRALRVLNWYSAGGSSTPTPMSDNGALFAVTVNNRVSNVTSNNATLTAKPTPTPTATTTPGSGI